ncbi:hypothetical protein ThidrDRAFT_3193 [Thiorhodococcus drewsii AZ1]|uniref:Restriction endonuclease type IV Mrr domain-containing protein n=1 Tax=Thiorhodococcus drewsii AZ1 TaxID=765913 RepID=G2E4I0_9GAMM|nr:restriction endonuclease [Thiorhodococcus drewsii]EGV29601.1 hypothetical protein ThidrDRAFT_3193 [Thiorhodococcus drewsii AZ1]
MAGQWERYKIVAAYLLEKIKKELNLKAIEGKQKLVGEETGTEWEIDAKGVSEEGDGIVLIECRRYTKSRQSQEKIAAFAYRIHDTKADGGIIVSPLGLQSGAKKVADANNIISVEIDANSTPANFTVRFLKQLFIGMSASLGISARSIITVSKKCPNCGEYFVQTGT